MPVIINISDAIAHFEEEFSGLQLEVQELLSQKQNVNPNKLQNCLLDMSLTKNVNAENMHKIFFILGHYSNNSFNYELLFHIFKRFCHCKLNRRMLRYRDSLINFEKSTPVNVYLRATSDHPIGKIRGFIHVNITFKSSSECMLYDIRELMELIVEKGSLEAYTTFIETIQEGLQEGSVMVVLQVHEEVGDVVCMVVTAPDFGWKYCVIEVTIEEKLRQYNCCMVKKTVK